MLPSNECSILPKSSELSISSASDFRLSGLAISFGKTLPYLPQKTVTRRCWKHSHALKFINAFHQHKLVKALDKDIRYGGKQIGWCRLLCAPYKEKLSSMPDTDLLAEGGMCESVEAFIQQYFKGDASLEVWVIRFEFIAADKPAQIPTGEALGVYSDSIAKGNSNSATTLLATSIHQTLLSGLGVCADSTGKTDSYSLIASATESIHQTSLIPLGVYSAIQYKTNRNFPISLSIESIHQASPEHQTALGVYQSNGNQVDINTAITSPIKSIHQASIDLLGVHYSDGHFSDTKPANNLLTESIHQAPVVQGGSGLVYAFWKGESMVNHYRYKVKVNGKWKVRSIYIPVGKLPKVREAIISNLGVTGIVTKILGKELK